MRQPTNRKYSSWFVRHLEDISAEDLTKALESEEIRSSPKDFLILAKMLCAKKGMPHNEWEELLHEQKKRQSLRQMGISEDFVTEIVDLLIQAMFYGINGQIGCFLSFDERRELKCSICPEKPYRAWTIHRAKQGSDIYDAIVAVLCKEHFKRVAVRPDIKLIHTIAEAAMQSRHRYKKEGTRIAKEILLKSVATKPILCSFFYPFTPRTLLLLVQILTAMLLFAFLTCYVMFY